MLPSRYWPAPVVELARVVEAAGRKLDVRVRVDDYGDAYEVSIRVPRQALAAAADADDRQPMSTR
ncbi:hypothetical protein [Pendulispora albinea]|uniref:Uncharacterized protein n=1 Tax=Pendulispora albinea TaxID=2741071 RepID=A0ABZ2MBZ4_9BACT